MDFDGDLPGGCNAKTDAEALLLTLMLSLQLS